MRQGVGVAKEEGERAGARRDEEEERERPMRNIKKRKEKKERKKGNIVI